MGNWVISSTTHYNSTPITSSVFTSAILLLALILAAATTTTVLAGGIGVNWGTQASNPLSPDVVVTMLKDNGIQKVKLFDADKGILNALSESGIEVMVGIPNEMLYSLANDNVAAQNWVEQNITSHVSSSSDDSDSGGGGSGVNIKYVAVGNEPFLKTFNGSYHSLLLPALQNIQFALNKAGHGNKIKVTVPLNADVYETSTGLPSGGDFQSDIFTLMLNIVTFLTQNRSPFTVNIYPFISLYTNPDDFPFDYAFFDGYTSPVQDTNGKTYDNMLDANYDTLVWALQKNGFPNMQIVLGEVGWPTDGDVNANPENARRFNQGFINRASKGTPMRPSADIDAYLFSLIDEDAKDIRPGKFERHWGLFYFDGIPKYHLYLGNDNTIIGLIGAMSIRHLPRRWCVMAPSASLDDPHIEASVAYACGHADCTSLGFGCSCDDLDIRGNISYAFNSYYQANGQLDTACKFANLSMVTTSNPATRTCKFFVGIEKTDVSSRGRCDCKSSQALLITFLAYVSLSFVFS